MTLMERELFDLHVYGTTQPHIDGRKQIEAAPHPVATEEEETHVRAFAMKIIDLDRDFRINHPDQTQTELTAFLTDILELVSAELGDTSQFARDIRAEIDNHDAKGYYCDTLLRIRDVFDLQ